jgi:hypothetical protein
MTGEQSRQLHVGDRVCWQNNRADQGTIAEKNWAGETIKWDKRQNRLANQPNASILLRS